MSGEMKPARSILDQPGMSEAIDALVAKAPPPTPEQIELVNRVFRPTPKPAARPARSTA